CTRCTIGACTSADAALAASASSAARARACHSRFGPALNAEAGARRLISLIDRPFLVAVSPKDRRVPTVTFRLACGSIPGTAGTDAPARPGYKALPFVPGREADWC